MQRENDGQMDGQEQLLQAIRKTRVPRSDNLFLVDKLISKNTIWANLSLIEIQLNDFSPGISLGHINFSNCYYKLFCVVAKHISKIIEIDYNAIHRITYHQLSMIGDALHQFEICFHNLTLQLHCRSETVSEQLRCWYH